MKISGAAQLTAAEKKQFSITTGQVLRLMEGDIAVAKKELTSYFKEHDADITQEQASYLANCSMEVLKTVGQVVVHQVAAKRFHAGKKRAAKVAKDAKVEGGWVESGVKTRKSVFTQTAKEGDLIFFFTKIGDDVIEFGGNFSKTNGTLTIKNFDVDGTLTNKLGIRGIKNVIADFGRQQGVNRVIIQGAARTTGANPGKIPSQLIFKID